MENSTSPTVEMRSVPKAAFAFHVGAMQFAAKGEDGQVPVSVRARSGKPIQHWYWGKVAHDMAGFQAAAPSVPLDYCHNDDEIIGFLDKFTPSNDGLDCSGQVVPFTDDDRASEVAFKSAKGVPYQSSIYFDSDNVVIEQVGMGAKAKVNGYELEGPATIFRQWMLRGVATCPYGYDINTSTRLSAGPLAGEVNVHITTLSAKSEAMENIQKPTAPETKPAELATAPAVAPVVATPATQIDPVAQFKATLAKFTAKFGAANGAAWAAEGLSYEAALEKHATELAASNKTLSDAKTALEGKLAAVPRGEEAPVSFTTTEKHEGGEKVPTKFAGLGKLGAFAANLKIPGQPAK